MSTRKPQLPVVATRQLEAQRHAAAYAGAQVLGLKWYRNYPGDNLSTARGWPAVALAAYHALRDVQWDLASLPKDQEELRRVSGFQTREWRIAWPLVEVHFPLETDSRRRNQALAKQRYDAVGRRWQQVDAINMRHHSQDGAYVGASADTYWRAHVPVDERTDEHTHQHQSLEEPLPREPDALEDCLPGNRIGVARSPVQGGRS